MALLLAAGLAFPLPTDLGAQSGHRGQGGATRATGQVHRTIRRTGRGPLPAAVHGTRLGTSTAAVAGSGTRPGSPNAPGPDAFVPRLPRGIGDPGHGGPGAPGHARRPGHAGILLGLPRHLVHGPLVIYRRGAGGAAERGPGVPGPGTGGPGPGGGPALELPPLPPAAAAPRGLCAVVTVRLEAGPTRRLRIDTGPLGVSTLAEARARLRERLQRGEPIALRGREGSGLLVAGGDARELELEPCPGAPGGG